ncbi:unnamed protein product [Closterium sp. NIES-54]
MRRIRESSRTKLSRTLRAHHPESGTQLAMGLTCDSPPCTVSEGRTGGGTGEGGGWGVAGGWGTVGGKPMMGGVSEPSVGVADRPGLLMVIVDVLTGMFVSVTSAEIDTEGVVAKDVFTVSYHGGPLDVEMITLTLNALNYTLSRARDRSRGQLLVPRGILYRGRGGLLV